MPFLYFSQYLLVLQVVLHGVNVPLLHPLLLDHRHDLRLPPVPARVRPDALGQGLQERGQLRQLRGVKGATGGYRQLSGGYTRVLHERRADAAVADGHDGVELVPAAGFSRGDGADDACVVGGGQVSE